MIHVITEIVERSIDDEFTMEIVGYIRGDATSTDKEFQMAKAFMKRMTRQVERAAEAAKLSGIEVHNFSTGGKSLIPDESEE